MAGLRALAGGLGRRRPGTRLLATDTLRVRQQFEPPPPEALQWFPGHMRDGWHQMEAKLRAVDAVIEVHDARVPLSGRNARIAQALAARPRPADQADAGLRGVARALAALIAGQERAARADAREFNCMVVGVPNVGKSSLINALRSVHLRRAAATPVGTRAGVTRSVLTRIKVSARPLIYVRDTPGVLEPRLEGAEAGLRLALCAAMQDHLVGPRLLADYLLYWMNRRANHAYVPYMARPDVREAALHMVRGFRSGAFGQLLLDDDVLEDRAPPPAG
ncbi:Mitochondrial GTPase 1 [Amphibalanus amphitrite]|uniref:Mitochondrial GTPase 1 n=1 Tax=Amphibalanus amphitrite TaxID=1232801 RepID=A0A6A4WF48_AMPAM|nr:Mitochondrial GTPase 1 [Amphibalanus amphitrite]